MTPWCMTCLAGHGVVGGGVRGLPYRRGGGLDGQIGEMGGRLSGGQRQRLALARALATDAPVLVLHDPTTAVDSVTETTIASRLRQIRQGRSTILIASSPTLMGVCDRIIDLRDRDAHDQEGDMS